MKSTMLALVSVPYEITLLSNSVVEQLWGMFVSVPYEITLLSNGIRYVVPSREFQYLMKLHYSQTKLTVSIIFLSFSTL